MQGAVVIVTALAVACVGEPILKAQRLGAIYKGPDSETIIAGPDGSVITAAAAGGVVDASGGAGLVGPILVSPERDAEIVPVVVSPAKTLIQHEPIIVSSPYPLVHDVSSALIAAEGPHVVVGHENSATVHASNGLGHSASASVSTSGGVVTAHAKVSSSPTVIAAPIVRKVVTVSEPVVSVVTAPKVVALEEPAPIIPIPEPPVVEVRHADTALIGPSGTISTKGGSAAINGPASLTISNNGVVSEAIKVDTVPVAVAPVVNPVVVETLQPLREAVVVSTPKSVVLVQDVEPARINLGPQTFLTENVRESVVVSGPPTPVVAANYELAQRAAAIEREQIIAQSLTPPRVAEGVYLQAGPAPPQHVIATQQQVVATERLHQKYAHPTQHINPYQGGPPQNIPLHPPYNSVPGAILDRHASYSANIAAARAPHL